MKASRGADSMAGIILFGASFVCFVAGAAFYFISDNNNYAGYQKQVAAYKAEVEKLQEMFQTLPENQSKKQIEDIWAHFSKIEEGQKGALEKLYQKIQLNHQIEVNALRNPRPQTHIVKFEPLSINKVTTIQRPPKKASPLIDRAGIKHEVNQ